MWFLKNRVWTAKSRDLGSEKKGLDFKKTVKKVENRALFRGWVLKDLWKSDKKGKKGGKNRRLVLGDGILEESCLLHGSKKGPKKVKKGQKRIKTAKNG